VRLSDQTPVTPPAQPRAVHLPAAATPGGVVLPKTATDAEIRMVLGAVLMLLSFLLLMLRRFALRRAS
jgi:LPXTG-motif cell wall-anchored protein